MTDGDHVDVLIVGSGFGGSVAALRATEKGYKVAVIEAGQRFTDGTLPKNSWKLKQFLWAPRLGLRGIQRIHKVGNVMVLAGAGVGGGSLNYANTLYQPPAPFYVDPQWRDITDWHDELDPWYAQARAMLGVVQNPTVTPADEVYRAVAEKMGVGSSFVLTPVGVFFGRDGKQEPGATVPDPYFGGAGPDRTGCTQCGDCMVGCKVGAKNTLVKNYLYLAEAGGATIVPDTTVTEVRARAAGGYDVVLTPTGWSRTTITVTADQVVLAAGTLGTQRLLHAMKDRGVLPKISQRLGLLTRTNSESILGASTPKVGAKNFSEGVAITSSFHPDSVTHIEPCRYGKGSNAMGLLATVLTDGDGKTPRAFKAAGIMARHPVKSARVMVPHRWSERTIAVLVMQTLDNSITTFTKKGLFGRKVSATQGHGAPNPTWIPLGNEATRLIAEEIGGEAGGSWGDLANIPMTAHFIGGCAIGATPEQGVIDGYQRLFGYDGISVVDGSAISANLGVNPSLTITAQAERALSLWPNKGEADLRPPVGAAYQRVDAVVPKNPMVPSHAPAALRTPVRSSAPGAAA